MKKIVKRKRFLFGTFVFVMIAGITAWIYCRHANRALLEFEIHINRNAIYLSTYSEPPQFAVWLENMKNGRKKQVFVTGRAGTGDWEGKADVPSAIPHWVQIFRNGKDEIGSDEITISGATPKEEYFRIEAEVPSGSEWTAWIEMNLAGDYNEYYPPVNLITHEEDEFACGQPALLYRADISAVPCNEYKPGIVALSLWENGKARLAAPDSTITSAGTVFDEINIRVVKPKFRFINLKKSHRQEVLR